MKKIYNLILILLINIMFFIMFQNHVYAAGATITASKTEVTVGTTIDIYANISCSASWKLNLTSSGGNLKVTEDTVSTTNDGENASTKVKIATFSANATGTYTISLSGYVVDGEKLVKESVSGEIKIQVSEVQTQTTPATNQNTNTNTNTNNNASTNNTTTETTQKSTNAKLSNLGINPSEYDFNDFKSNKTSYTATVPYEIEEVEVWYKKSDSKSTVKVTGGSNLEVGQNEITVKVTAEDGKTTKTYTINVERQAEQIEEEIPAENEETTIKGLQQLSIVGLTLTPEFSTDIYEYQATLTEDKTSLDITALAMANDETVVIAGNEELKEGENIISVIVYNSENGVDATYQITVTKELTTTATEENSLNVFGKEINIESINIKFIIIVVVLVIIGITLLVILLKNKKQISENDEDYTETNVNYQKEENIEENILKKEEKTKKKSIRKRKGKHF